MINKLLIYLLIAHEIDGYAPRPIFKHTFKSPELLGVPQNGIQKAYASITEALVYSFEININQESNDLMKKV